MELKQTSSPGGNTSVRRSQAGQRRRQEALEALRLAGSRGLTSGEAGAMWVVALSSKVSDLKRAGAPILKTYEKGRGIVYRLENEVKK